MEGNHSSLNAILVPNGSIDPQYRERLGLRVVKFGYDVPNGLLHGDSGLSRHLRSWVSFRVRDVAELLKRKSAFLGDSAIMCVDTFLGVVSGHLSALFSGHKAAGPAALKAVAIRDMLKAADLALAAAFETLVSDLVGHWLTPAALVAVLMAGILAGVNDFVSNFGNYFGGRIIPSS
jgi:hypothetical protein